MTGHRQRVRARARRRRVARKLEILAKLREVFSFKSPQWLMEGDGVFADLLGGKDRAVLVGHVVATTEFANVVYVKIG